MFHFGNSPSIFPSWMLLENIAAFEMNLTFCIENLARENPHAWVYCPALGHRHTLAISSKWNIETRAKCLQKITPAIWGFPKMVVPPKHPKMIIFSRKTHGHWVPPFGETPIYYNWTMELKWPALISMLHRFDSLSPLLPTPGALLHDDSSVILHCSNILLACK